jgi:hypothetical protein
MAFTPAQINAALDAASTGITHAQLHTGAPGAAGTANVAAGVARCALTGVGSASAAADTWTGAFTIPGAGGPFTHVSFWTALSAGTFKGDAPVSPQETFAGAGTLNLTVNVTGT